MRLTLAAPLKATATTAVTTVLAVLAFVVLAVWSGPVAAQATASAEATARSNVFNDPFVQLTTAMAPADCPAPSGPMLTEAEARAQAHSRAERGTSCFQSGRCRLPNAYLYDQEIIPRVQKAVSVDGRFARDTSVWALGQRRWVWLQGCVRSADQAVALERLVKQLDDVEAVVNELRIVPGSATAAASHSGPPGTARPAEGGPSTSAAASR